MEINQEILKKYASGQCSGADKHLVEKWLNNDSWDSMLENKDINEEIGSDLWNNLSTTISQNRKLYWARLTAAAAVILIQFILWL